MYMKAVLLSHLRRIFKRIPKEIDDILWIQLALHMYQPQGEFCLLLQNKNK